MPGTSPPQVGADFGDYRIESVLGRGAMGVVYRARQRRLDRPVALKVLPVDTADDPSYRARFAREAAALARLDSPHVIQIYDHGELDGHLYLAMQLVAGPDLGRVVEEAGPLGPRRALRITAQLATALGDGHAVGVLHRDVKPSNVLLRPAPAHDPEAEDFVYLCDFGIAREVDGTASETAGVIGTLGYMAPERLHGDAALPASDVYSLGCLLWTLLVGRPPYVGTQPEVIMGHVQAPVPQLAGDDPRTRRLNALLADVLAKDPARRPTTTVLRERIGELLATAGPADGGAPARAAGPVGPAPVRTTPPGPPAGRVAAGPAATRRPTRRTLLVAGAGAAVLLVAGGLLAESLLEPARTASSRLGRATPAGVSCAATAVPDAAATAGAVAQAVCSAGPDVGELRLAALSGDSAAYLRDVARQDPQALPEGACPQALPARSRWSADGHSGTVLCYVLGSTTRYAWTFDDLDVVAVLDGRPQDPFPRDVAAVAAFFDGARYG